jgi:hypothetical protein
MTIREYVANADKPDRVTSCNVHATDSPFVIVYNPNCERHTVNLTDLPYSSDDLGKTEAARAWNAYIALRAATYDYIHALRSGEADSWTKGRHRDEIQDILQQVMSPKSFFWAVWAVHRDVDVIHAGISRYLERNGKTDHGLL